MTHVQTTESFVRDIYKSLNPSRIFRLSWPYRGFSCSEDTQIWNHIRHIQLSRSQLPSQRSFHHGAVFHYSESLPLRGSPRPEGPNSDPESTSTYWNLHLPLRSTILPTLKTCNTLKLKRAVIQGSRFFGMQSRLISASDHGCYNKFSTCSYNHPPISPPLQHPCQVHMITLILGEGNRSLL